MGEICRITWNDKVYEYPKGTSYAEIVKDFQKEYKYPIVLVVVDGKLRELHHSLKKDCNIDFEMISGHFGHKAYKRSCCFLLVKSFYDVVDPEKIDRVKIEFSIGSGYYISVRGDFKLTDELVSKVRDRMLEIIKEDRPFVKKSYSVEEIRNRIHTYGMLEKEDLFKYRMASKVNMYHLGEFMDYYYGYMLPSTGYIKAVDLFSYRDGMILNMAEKNDPYKVPKFNDGPHLFNIMMDATKWNAMLGIETVGALNKTISDGGFNDLVLIQEALQEHKIADLAQDIAKQNKKFVMIAGPSSSGKTSFSHRLSIQLVTQGKKPHPIALDNFFLNRVDTPLLPSGKPDFESLRALDIDFFNQSMTDLLKGKAVDMPSFNFITGEREFNGNIMKLGPDDVLVIEGIHGLNDELSYTLPKESKYKIYISALTTLNIDEHNRITTTDGRLIRRMVRDFRTRGASAIKTLGMWNDVRNGEVQNIFPFQESADAMFNSALVYELSVLKQFVEPLLFDITPDKPEYQEALRLLKFLQYFLGVDTEGIPRNSLIREFIGGSVFNVG
ncbi:MAG: nucleoside kinase [Lachnospiraceae bacterium]|nr:nucleoside kinase [Lachnospiraceae bacterium]